MKVVEGACCSICIRGPWHSDTNQWFFNPVDDKRQVTRVLLILAHVVSRTNDLEGTGCVLDGGMGV